MKATVNQIIKKSWIILITILLGLVPIIWFWGRKGVLINGLDTNFPLDPKIWLARRFFVWNDTVNAGQDFSSSISGFFFHGLQALPYYLGIDLQIVEIINLVFWFSVVVFSSFFFIREVIPKSKMAQLVFVSIYAFNTYLFNTWENVKVANLALVVAVPAYLAIIHSYYQGNIRLTKLFFYSALVALITAGSGINPAYFGVIIFCLVVYGLIISVWEKGIKRKIVFGLASIIVVTLLLNLYWIAPLFNYLFISAKINSLSSIGLTDWLASLSKDTSLFNVFRLQGAWDWYARDTVGFPLYIPYALNYFFRLPFLLFSFILPALSLLALAFRSDRKSGQPFYSLFGAFLILGIFFGAGLHEPTGKIYQFLVNHLPLFSLFRSPWYIFTPLAILAMAGLTGLFYAHIEETFVNRLFFGRIKMSRLPVLFAIVFIVGNLIYCYPLITGKIFRPGREDSFYVKFPDYLWQTKNWLANQNVIQGRAISYPDDDLENFNWGYRGTESILGLFSPQEFAASSFNSSYPKFTSFLKELYRQLKNGHYQTVLSMMPFLGADTLFVKGDAKSLAPKIPDLSLRGELSKNNFGPWNFYTLPRANFNGKVFPVTAIYTSLSDYEAFPPLTPLINNRSVLVGSGDTEVSKISNPNISRLSLGEAENLSLENDPLSSLQNYQIIIAKDSKYKIVLEKKDFSLADLDIWLDGVPFIKSNGYETDNLIVVGSVNLSQGKHIIKVRFPEVPNLFPTNDLSTYYQIPDLRQNEIPVNLAKTMVLYSDSPQEKRIRIPVKEINPSLNYVFSYDYKYFYGSIPYFDVLQFNPSTPLKVFPDYPGSSSDWERRTVNINPAEIESELELAIRLPRNDNGARSKSFVENLTLRQVYDNRLFFLEVSDVPQTTILPEMKFTKVSPVEYKVEVTNISAGYILAFLESYSSDWVLSSVGGSIGKPLHFTINGYANGWYIPPTAQSQKLVIYYKPQRLFKFGLALSGAILVAIFGVVVVDKVRERRSVKKLTE